jgi:hypothetical protein
MSKFMFSIGLFYISTTLLYGMDNPGINDPQETFKIVRPKHTRVTPGIKNTPPVDSTEEICPNIDPLQKVHANIANKYGYAHVKK